MTQTRSEQIQDFCTTCGKPKRQLKKMSLTQWMFSAEACNCDASGANQYTSHRPKEFTSVMELCTDCGLPVLTGRAGSMTQWIFGASSCHCKAKLLQDGAAEFAPKSGSEVNAQTALNVPQFHVSDEVSPLTVELGLPEDRYQAVKLVGQGAISKVYECQDRLLQRVVAIKFLIASKWTGEEIKRFQTEAKATSKLTHPNIVLVHDFGSTHKGQPYMVLEYFTGVSLEDLVIKRGPLPEDVAAEIGVQIAGGMHFAHTKHILHRDIKPANVMLIETGEHSIVAKVIDFGIADLSADQSLSIKGQSVVGTPNYMSPDEVQGRKADARSDVYSLGCTLFEAMTGRPPFVADTALELITMHVNDVAPLLNEAYPAGEFSDAMENLIEKSLAKEPADRFQTMGEMRDALSKIHQGAASTLEFDETQGDLDATTNGAAPKPKNKTKVAITAGAIAAIAAGIMFLPKPAAPPAPSEPLPKTDRIDWQSPFEIDIDNNMMGDDALKPYLKKKHTTHIKVRAANITDKGLDYIMHLPLENLGLEGTKISDKGFRRITKIPHLKGLNLSHSPQLTAYDSLTNCPELTSMFFLNNELNDDHLKYFEPLTQLETVNISDNPHITGTGLTCFKNAKNLNDLRLSSLQFTADGIKTLTELSQVDNLNLRYTNIQDKDLDQIVQMKGLKTLNLDGTAITDKGVKKLEQIKHLKLLFAGRCKNISRDALVQLQRKRPKLRINLDGQYAL